MTEPLDNGVAAIGLRFGVGAAVGGGLGPGSVTAADDAAGMLARPVKRPVTSFVLPPGILTATTVGSFLDLPHQFGPRTGWFWDITALSATGFTAGTIGVSKNAPFVTTAGSPYAIEPVAVFSSAGVLTFGQKGMPLLDSSERLVFTVTAAITGSAQISGQVVLVPAERLDEYLS